MWSGRVDRAANDVPLDARYLLRRVFLRLEAGVPNGILFVAIQAAAGLSPVCMHPK
jgi:hypothetical protein